MDSKASKYSVIMLRFLEIWRSSLSTHDNADVEVTMPFIVKLKDGTYVYAFALYEEFQGYTDDDDEEYTFVSINSVHTMVPDSPNNVNIIEIPRNDDNVINAVCNYVEECNSYGSKSMMEYLDFIIDNAEACEPWRMMCELACLGCSEMLSVYAFVALTTTDFYDGQFRISRIECTNNCIKIPFDIPVQSDSASDNEDDMDDDEEDDDDEFDDECDD